MLTVRIVTLLDMGKKKHIGSHLDTFELNDVVLSVSEMLGINLIAVESMAGRTPIRELL